MEASSSRYNLRKRTNKNNNNNTTNTSSSTMVPETKIDRIPLLEASDSETENPPESSPKFQVQNFSKNTNNLLSSSEDSLAHVQTVNNDNEETPFEIAKQVFFPYIMAALGLVAAGLVLDDVQHWEVFNKVKELYVLVPSLLGLKGNLEMTLASRMSTAANNGLLDSKEQRWSMIKGNMALIQCQASVVATLAALIAMLMSWIPSDTFILDHAMIMCASALYTAAIASAVLSFLMMMIIVYSHKYNKSRQCSNSNCSKSRRPNNTSSLSSYF